MKFDYMLKIHCPDEAIASVSKVLGIEPTEREYGYWGFELSERDSDDPVYFVDEYLGMLDGKYRLLERIGIARKDISVWVFGEYSGQCAMQFSSAELRRLGENGVDLCIECWEANDD